MGIPPGKGFRFLNKREAQTFIRKECLNLLSTLPKPIFELSSCGTMPVIYLTCWLAFDKVLEIFCDTQVDAIGDGCNELIKMMM